MPARRFVLLLALLLPAAALIITGCGGSGSGPSEDDFREADRAMAEVIAHLEAGDLSAAFAAFGAPHDFTHELDGPLREKDAALADRLNQAVLTMEAHDSSDQEVLAAAREARAILREAAQAFGYHLEE